MKTHYIKATVVLDLESDADGIGDLQWYLIDIAKNILSGGCSELLAYEHITKEEFESAKDGGENAFLTAEGGL